MHELTPQQRAANIMAAAAHLLVGEPGRDGALNDHVAIMCGPSVDTMNLLNWTGWVRRHGCPIIHFSFDDPQIPIPTVAMVCVSEGRGLVFESCSLWLPQSGGGAWIIPDGDGWGAYRIGADMTLQHRSRPPVRRGKAAEEGYVRAYSRLLEITAAQIESGLVLSLPTRLEQRAA